MPESTFEQQVKQALRLFHNPQRLGSDSPLAAPYFLRQRMDLSTHNQLTDPSTLYGELLCDELYTAALQLWGQQPPTNLQMWRAILPEVIQTPRMPRYSHLVLELTYFQKCFKPAHPSIIWEEYLMRSRPAYFRDLEVAISQLSQILLNLLYP